MVSKVGCLLLCPPNIALGFSGSYDLGMSFLLAIVFQLLTHSCIPFVSFSRGLNWSSALYWLVRMSNSLNEEDRGIEERKFSFTRCTREDERPAQESRKSV